MTKPEIHPQSTVAASAKLGKGVKVGADERLPDSVTF